MDTAPKPAALAAPRVSAGARLLRSREAGIVAALVLMVALLAAVSPEFRTADNLLNNARNLSFVGVVALGNGPWRSPADPESAWTVVDHGLALLRAAALGLDLPPDPPGDPPGGSPDPPDPPGDHPADATTGGELPGELAALVGTYAAWNPWISQVKVRPGGDGLVLAWPEVTGAGDQTQLERHGGRIHPAEQPGHPRSAREGYHGACRAPPGG